MEMLCCFLIKNPDSLATQSHKRIRVETLLNVTGFPLGSLKDPPRNRSKT